MQIHFLPASTSPVTSSSNSNNGGAIFVIDDGSQPRIELSSKDRNLIAATFTHFLIKNIGGSETFKDKQDFFYHEVRKFHGSNCFHEKLAVKVQREKILESSMKATKNFSGNN
jgi:apoptosis-resistant E3 ubiquitin protein ligase 1